jgi:hypothetical protein
MPARQEPRVDAEPHGGPPAVTGPDRFRPQPPELGQGERAGQSPVRELGRQQRGCHLRPVGHARVEAPRMMTSRSNRTSLARKR